MDSSGNTRGYATRALLFAAGVALAAAGVFAWTAFSVFYTSGSDDMPVPKQTAASEAPPPSSLPARLVIPSLHINAKVEHVGIDKAGNMRTPSTFFTTGWYKNGTVPGYRGSAVIDGHVDNALSLSGVFKRLSEMKMGDDVYVVTVGGDQLHFVVVDIQSYPYREAPLTAIFTRADTARLNLVTCTGSWIRKEQTYSERLVVYTELASS